MIILKKIRNAENEFEVTDVEFKIDDNDMPLSDLRDEIDNFLLAIGYRWKEEDE